MYQLFITHTPHGVCYLLTKDQDGNVIYILSIPPTAFFDLRDRKIPEVPYVVSSLETYRRAQ
jgi:hypothetical protein